MRHPDLGPLTQAALLSLVVLLAVAAVIRAALILRKQRDRVLHRYPGTWTNDQIKSYKQLRMWIGLVLAMTWVSLWLAAPRMPQAWPFGLEETLLTAGLLLLTNAWLLLLVPADWDGTILNRLQFTSTFAILALWWTALLAGFLVTIEMVASKQLHFTFPLGTYA